MSEEQPDQLVKSKWNYSATLAFFVIATGNIVTGAAMITGKMTVQDWAAMMGPLNGIVLGWVSKAIN